MIPPRPAAAAYGYVQDVKRASRKKRKILSHSTAPTPSLYSLIIIIIIIIIIEL